MWAISQGCHATEIAHFKRSSLESRLLEGEKRIAYWCMPTITLQLSLCFSCLIPFFLSNFPIFSLIFHSFFSLVFISYVFFPFSSFSYVTPHCAQLRPLLYCLSFLDHLLICRLPSLTTYLCWPCHIPFLDKRVLFCFLTLYGIPIRIRVDILSY